MQALLDGKRLWRKSHHNTLNLVQYEVLHHPTHYLEKNMSKLTRSTQRRLILKGAALDVQIKALSKELEEIKAALAVLPDGLFSAGDSEVILKTADRASLDGAMVKGFLTPAQIIAATKSTPVQTIKFRIVPPVKAAA